MHISGKRVRYVGLPKSLNVHHAIGAHFKAVAANRFHSGQRQLRKDRYAYLRQQMPSTSLNQGDVSKKAHSTSTKSSH